MMAADYSRMLINSDLECFLLPIQYALKKHINEIQLSGGNLEAPLQPSTDVSSPIGNGWILMKDNLAMEFNSLQQKEESRSL